VTPVRNNPWIFRTGLQAKLPFKDKPLPGTVAPKAAKLSKMADLFDLEGNLGLNIGEITRVDLSPAVSHTFKEKLSVGAGPIFQYYDDKKLDVNSATFGGRFFTRFKPKEHFPFFQVEAETLNGKEVSPLLKNAQNSERQWYSALMAGGGVNFPLGLKSSFNISALRNLTYQGPNPVRNSPWVIRAGLQL
uniref:hypothetical protein n=1 Tax=Flexithrix dorotheae TaxID=70993 RepID=UPI00036E98EB